MTLEDMIVEVFELAGDPTDIYPYDAEGDVDLELIGSRRITRWINSEYKRIVGGKFPRGEIWRFRDFERKVVFEALDVEDTVVSADGVTIVLDDALEVDGKYTSWVMEFNGEKRIIAGYDGDTQTATLMKPFSSDPEPSDEVLLYKKFFRFSTEITDIHPGEVIPVDPVSGIMNVQRVVNVTNDTILARADRMKLPGLLNRTIKSFPGIWFDIAEGIEFDVVPESGLSFELTYSAIAENLVAVTDRPKIPESWHPAIVLNAASWAMLRKQEYDAAYALRKNAESLIASLQQQFETSWDKDETHFYVES